VVAGEWAERTSVAQWAAELIRAADISVDSVGASLAVADSSAATLVAASPSVAAASSAQALASSQRGRFGGTTIGVTAACHGGSGRQPDGANAYANPLDMTSFGLGAARRGRRRRLSFIRPEIDAHDAPPLSLTLGEKAVGRQCRAM